MTAAARCRRPGLLSAACAGLVLVLAPGPARPDPMRPLASATPPSAASAARAAPAAAPPALRLPALVAIREDSDGRRRALLGERWLGIGDRVEGLTVATIAPHHVELVHGKARQVLRLLTPLQPPSEPAAATADAPPGTALAQAGRSPRRTRR